MSLLHKVWRSPAILLLSTFRLENVLLGRVCTWGDYCLFPLPFPQTSQWETVLLSLSSLPRRLSWLPRRGKTQPHSPVPSLEISQTLTGLKALGLYNCICMEKKVRVVNACPCSSLCNSQLSESSETDSDASKVNSRSEELLQTPFSSTSTDSSFGDGMQLTVFKILYTVLK